MITYASGMNRRQIGQWYDESYAYVKQFDDDIVALEFDFSKFDKHHTVKHLKLEHKIFNRLLPMDDNVKKGYKSTLMTTGYMPSGMKYRVPATRKSGFQDTTLGNTVLNGTTHLFILANIFDCKVEDLQKMPIRLIVLGDDCYVLTTRKIGQKYVEEQLSKHMGWHIKKAILPVEQATFCSGIFMPDSKGTYLTGLPGRALVRTFCKMNKLTSDIKQKFYAFVVASGLLADHAHDPLIKPLARRIMLINYDSYEHYQNKIPNFIKYKAYEYGLMHGERGEVCEATYDFIQRRYNLSINDLNILKQYYNGIKHFKVGLEHEIIDKIVSVDVEDKPNYDWFKETEGELWDIVDNDKELKEPETEPWWDECMCYEHFDDQLYAAIDNIQEKFMAFQT